MDLRLQFVKCPRDPYCKGCYYYRGAQNRQHGIMYCMYWDIEPGLRGCPPGKGCTKYTKKKPTKKEMRNADLQPRKTSWDKERGYKLYCQGNYARTIAIECCCSTASVNMMFAEWKKRAEAEGIVRDKISREVPSKWDKEQGYKLFCDGWTYDEIAKHFEVGGTTVERASVIWRDRAIAEGIDRRARVIRRRKAMKGGKND
ncbi:MAG: hypothetical protein MJY95_08335 [Bacteroidaceae bacterium]|nr:hypothetical protein [Bacteroidaceae bacterium]